MFTTCTICMSPEPRASRYSSTCVSHLFRYLYVIEKGILSATIGQELFDLDLVKHPLFRSENNIKSEEEKQLGQQIVGNYRE